MANFWLISWQSHCHGSCTSAINIGNADNTANTDDTAIQPLQQIGTCAFVFYVDERGEISLFRCLFMINGIYLKQSPTSFSAHSRNWWPWQYKMCSVAVSPRNGATNLTYSARALAALFLYLKKQTLLCLLYTEMGTKIQIDPDKWVTFFRVCIECEMVN